MRNIIKLILTNLFMATIAFNPIAILAQHSIGGLPYSFGLKSNLRLESNNNQIVLPKVNFRKLNAKLDSIRNMECKTCKGDYYGTGLDIDINIKKDGFLLDSNSQQKVWLLKICSDSAFGMQFYFDKYKLPKGGKLFFYNEERNFVLGAFTDDNNMENLRFGTQPIPGSCIYLEYSEPNSTSDSVLLHAYKAVHIFEREVVDYLGKSQSCEIDINCTEGKPYKEIAKAVCVIYYFDINNYLAAHCTGTLINTTENARKPYILTARHCARPHQGKIENTKHNEANWVFYFNYESPGCNDPNQFPWVRSTQSIFGGSEVIVGDDGDDNSDYALIKASRNPEISYDVKYLGWDRIGVVPSSVIGIHHPEGDVKKISFSNNVKKWNQDYYQGLQYQQDEDPRNVWQVIWNKGITERGSSGSPLIDASSMKVIGVLSSGSSQCISPTSPDYYAMLSYCWDKGAPPIGYVNPGISNFLDASNTGAYLLGSEIYNSTATCTDGIRNGEESAPDCGGICLPCSLTTGCFNGRQDPGETNMDCGGPCKPCYIATCYDGFRNQGEAFIDCGGPSCPPCSTLCNNGKLDGNEQEIDCGGDCTPCKGWNYASTIGTNDPPPFGINIDLSCLLTKNFDVYKYGFVTIGDKPTTSCNKPWTNWNSTHGINQLYWQGGGDDWEGRVPYDNVLATPPVMRLMGFENDLFLSKKYGWTGSGFFCEWDYLDPDKDYTLEFSYINLPGENGKGFNSFEIFAANKLVAVKPLFWAPAATTINDYKAPTKFPVDLNGLFGTGGVYGAYWTLDTPDGRWRRSRVHFNVNKYDTFHQLWIHAHTQISPYYPLDYVRYAYMAFDNVVLTSHEKCKYNLTINTSNLKRTQVSSNYAVTSGSLIIPNIDRITYPDRDNTKTVNLGKALFTIQANDYVLLNEGFETADNAEFVASIGSCAGLRSVEDEPFNKLIEIARSEQLFDPKIKQKEGNHIITEPMNIEYSVYPNPTSNFISLKVENASSGTRIDRIEIFDMVGNLIHTSNEAFLDKEGSVKFELGEINEGLYLMKVRSFEKLTTLKFVIQK